MANKVKHAMSQDAKDRSRARKVPGTKARKAARRKVQEMAASLNRVLRAGGEATPWQVACAKRRTIRRGGMWAA